MIRALIGTSSYIRHVFIQDTASTKGKGYAGITGGQCSMSYMRVGAAAPVAVPIVTAATLGTYAGSATQAAIKAIPTAGVPNAVGGYELHLPDNGLAVGAREVTFFLSDIGGSDAWAMLPLGLELVADDPSTRLFDTLTTTYNVASSIGLHLRNALDSTMSSRLSPSGTLATVTNVGTVTGNVNGTVASVVGAVGSVTGAVGSVTGAVGSVTGAVGSVTGAVGSVTGNVGGNVVGTVGSVVGAVGSVTAGVTVAAGGLGDTAPSAAFFERAADTLLKRDWTAIVGEPASRSVWNALRFLRNKWSIAGTTLTVEREDDATDAWTSALTTDAAAVPIVSSDPVG